MDKDSIQQMIIRLAYYGEVTGMAFGFFSIFFGLIGAISLFLIPENLIIRDLACLYGQMVFEVLAPFFGLFFFLLSILAYLNNIPIKTVLMSPYWRTKWIENHIRKEGDAKDEV